MNQSEAPKDTRPVTTRTVHQWRQALGSDPERARPERRVGGGCEREDGGGERGEHVVDGERAAGDGEHEVGRHRGREVLF